MEFNFGEKMKSLRKKRNLTQEQLAEIFNVSFQAVSKWETNAATPDISMFPIISNFYGVTTDELLGVDVSRTNEIVKEICEKADNLFNERKYLEALPTLRKAVIDYPAKEELQYRLARALSGYVRDNNEKDDDRDEAISIYMKILDTSANAEMRSKVLRELVYAHYPHDIPTAKTFLKQLAPFDVCYEYILSCSNLFEGQELADFLKSNIALFGNAILVCLEYFTNYNPLIITEEQMAPETIESAVQKVELMKKILA